MSGLKEVNKNQGVFRNQEMLFPLWFHSKHREKYQKDGHSFQEDKRVFFPFVF